MINSKDPPGKQVKAIGLGGSYTAGPLQVNLSYAQNKFDAGFNTTLAVGYTTAMVSATTAASSLITPAGYANLKERTLLATGITYQVTPQFNIGAQLYKFSQSNYGTAVESDATMFSIVGDYALSKRTDVYSSMDKVSFDSAGLVSYLNGAKSRTGYQAGLRHRF